MSKLKDIINMPYESLINLSKKENTEYLKSAVKYLTQSANRRIKTLLESPVGSFSPAYKKLKDAGMTKFDVRWLNKATSKDTGKLLEQFSEVKKFLQAKTSTISGWQKVRNQIAKRTGSKKLFQKEYKSKRSASYWTNKEKKFWNLYNKLVDEFGGIITELDSDRIQKMLYKIQNFKGIRKDKDDAFIQGVMENYIDELYRAKVNGRLFNDYEFEEEYRIKFNNIKEQRRRK